MSNELNRNAPNDDTQVSIAKGVGLQQEGRLVEAAKIYQEVLARSPQDFDAMHLLGLVALQQGRLDVAQRLIKTALTIRPNEVAAVSNLGISYLRDEQFEPALQWFDIATKLQPDSAIALTNLGQALYHMGRHRDAIRPLQKACTIDPSSFAAHNMLGACFMRSGDEHNAATLFEEATRLNPNDSEAWANLSVASAAIGRADRAREYANKAARLNPSSVSAFGAPAQSHRQGVAQAPSVEMLLSDVHILMGNGLHDEAMSKLESVLALDGNNVTARWALAFASLKAIYQSESAVLASREAFGNALNSTRSWYESASGVEAPYDAVGTVQPFALAYQHYNNRELLEKYGGLCVDFMSAFPFPHQPSSAPAPVDTRIVRKLRLGIVSAHIRAHSVWTAITKGWIEHLDREQFEIEVFHLSTTVDRETEAAMQAVSHFDNRAKSLSEWIDAISTRRLDVILYPEIGMDPQTVKLASLRLAPVQAMTWGHPETSGLPTIDLFISGKALEPADTAHENYSERLVMLPRFGVYVEPLSLPNADPELRLLQLPENQPLLLCPGQPFKYAPQYDAVWVKIAKGLQRKTLFRKLNFGRLVFFCGHNGTWDPILEGRLRAAFAAGGLKFEEHVSVLPFLEHARFFGLMRRSTLLLDTPGFSGFNTVLQGIECDLPVLAFEGDFMRGRLASGVLRELDLPELVATGPDDFVEKAVTLAKDAGRLKELRGKIMERRDALFRDVTPVRALERCLIEAAKAAVDATHAPT
jgi:predicted O-linked N-acetylglucosamine transferase (SPINDLY family)